MRRLHVGATCRGPARQRAPAGAIPRRPSDAGSGACLCAAEPVVEPDAAEARVAQRYERVLLDPAAGVAGLGVTHDLPRVADRLQIARDEGVERGAFRPGDLDDAVAWRRERHVGGDGSNIVRRDGLEQAGRQPDGAALRTQIGDAAEEFQELGRADDGVGEAGGLDQFLLGDLGAEVDTHGLTPVALAKEVCIYLEGYMPSNSLYGWHSPTPLQVWSSAIF